MRVPLRQIPLGMKFRPRVPRVVLGEGEVRSVPRSKQYVRIAALHPSMQHFTRQCRRTIFEVLEIENEWFKMPSIWDRQCEPEYTRWRKANSGVMRRRRYLFPYDQCWRMPCINLLVDFEQRIEEAFNLSRMADEY